MAKTTPRHPGYVRDRMKALAASGELNARNADRHWLYEESVQNVDRELEFIDRVFKRHYGRKPTFVREDFCGTALLCAKWVAHRRGNTALGVDFDGPTLDWGRANNVAPLGDRAGRVTLMEDDVRNVTSPLCDVLAATNFSWWGFKTRAALGAYFRNCHASLRQEGLLMLDCFGGPEAQVAQEEERSLEGFDYIWDQDGYNPITGETRCHIHFDFPDGKRLKRAFSYDWRIWTLAETHDLLLESGFSAVDVYWEGTNRGGEPNGIYRISVKGDSAPAWVAYLIARR
ncbi:MAG: class I SAM-dependent methyltransferase [bacterium]|nr:class I SAM-dependent methyltransferase [bacterium]